MRIPSEEHRVRSRSFRCLEQVFSCNFVRVCAICVHWSTGIPVVVPVLPHLIRGRMMRFARLLGCLLGVLLLSLGCTMRLERTGWHLDFRVDEAAAAAPVEKVVLP